MSHEKVNYSCRFTDEPSLAGRPCVWQRNLGFYPMGPGPTSCDFSGFLLEDISVFTSWNVKYWLWHVLGSGCFFLKANTNKKQKGEREAQKRKTGSSFSKRPS